MVDPEDADKTPGPLGIQSFMGEKENKAVVQLCKEHCRKAVTRTVGIRGAGCCPEQESGREASHLKHRSVEEPGNKNSLLPDFKFCLKYKIAMSRQE